MAWLISICRSSLHLTGGCARARLVQRMKGKSSAAQHQGQGQHKPPGTATSWPVAGLKTVTKLARDSLAPGLLKAPLDDWVGMAAGPRRRAQVEVDHFGVPRWWWIGRSGQGLPHPVGADAQCLGNRLLGLARRSPAADSLLLRFAQPVDDRHQGEQWGEQPEGDAGDGGHFFGDRGRVRASPVTRP